MIKALVVEDEKPAARQIISLLTAIHPKVEVIKVIDNVEELDEYLGNAPVIDVIFSDIQLGDGLSFDAYEKHNNLPPIIFTTAYDEYAIKAFKLNSIDYIVKPIDAEQLQFAVDKYYKQQISAGNINFNELLSALRTTEKNTKILIQKGEKLIAINPAEFLVIYTENRLVYAKTKADTYILSQTLEELHEEIGSASFFQINRQTIVNRTAIQSAEPTLDNGLLLTINHPTNSQLKVARRRVPEFKTWWVK